MSGRAKAAKVVMAHADAVAHAHFYCDSGEPWQPFENMPEQELNECESDLSDMLVKAMFWAQEV